MRPPVDLRTRRVPRLEHRPHRPQQLRPGVRRELGAGLLTVDPLERLDELTQIVGRQIRVVLSAALLLQRRERALEPVPVDPLHHLTEHLDQPPIRIEREPPVPRPNRKALRSRIVQPQIQDRVHHPRHRHRRPRPHRHEQRIVARPEPLPRPRLEPPHVLVHLRLQPLRQPTAGQVGATRIRRDREPGRNRHPELRHLRQPDPLPAQKLTATLRWLLEVVDVAVGHRRAIYPARRRLNPPGRSGAANGTPPARRASAGRTRRA